MNEQDGGPAFPSAQPENVFIEELGRYDERLGPPQGGMSLRDYFAGQVVAAVIAFEDRALDTHDDLPVEIVARKAYAVADAMLKARER